MGHENCTAGNSLKALITDLASADVSVRRTAALALDHVSDPTAMTHLMRLAEDESSSVRRVALHSISCASCKDEPVPFDVIPILVNAIKSDPSIRVRRVAAHLLGDQLKDRRAREALLEILGCESDEKLLRIAEWSLSRHLEDSENQDGSDLGRR